MSQLFREDIEIHQWPSDAYHESVLVRAVLTFQAEMTLSRGALTKSRHGQEALLSRAVDQLSEKIHRLVFDEAIGELAELRQELFRVDPEDSASVVVMIDRVTRLISLLQRGRDPG